MVTVCQTCGDIGFPELLVYCSQCHLSAMHLYCLDRIPKADDEDLTVSCEQCISSVTKQSSLNKLLNSHQARRSERAKKPRSGRVAKIFPRWKRRERDIVNGLVAETEAETQTSDFALTFQTSKPCMEGVPPEPEQLSSDCSPPSEDNRSPHSCSVNSDRDREIKKRRRLIIEDEGSCDEEAEYVKFKPLQVDLDAGGAPTSILSHHPPSESHNYVYAQPIIDPAWRGCFDICNEKSGTIFAHLSSKACLKAFEQAISLPPLLCMEMYSRLDVWPKSFSAAAPTDDNIALYFFPGSERDERTYDELVHQIIDFDLALKAVIDNVELLIFSSFQLPQHYWRFRGKYYLWGVFRGRQVSLPHKPAAHLLVRNGSTECVMSMSAVGSIEGSEPAKSRSAVGSIEGSDLAKRRCMRSPLSPLSSSSGNRSDSAHSPLHPKAKICSSEFVSSGYFKPLSDNASKSGDHERNPENLRGRVEEQGMMEECNFNFSNTEALPLPDSFDNTTNDENNGLGTSCLELFPLEVEDIAIATKMRDRSSLNLDLAL